ncbi:MAG: AMP-binding protein [Burkholderiales bacterium]|nr:AMP-binding protein [Burkholderiales bacterium]
MSERIVFGQRRIAAAEMEDLVARHAGALAATGLGVGDTLALLMRNDAEFALLSMAAGRLGAAVLAVNWHLRPEEVAYLLEDSGACLLIGHADLVSSLGTAAPGVARFAVTTAQELVDAYRIPAADAVPPASLDWRMRLAAARPWQGAPRPAPQTMLYTSGTTGRPKGVRRPPLDAAGQRRVAAVMAYVFGSRPGMRTLAVAPMYHGAPNAMALSSLRGGGALVIMPRFDAEATLAAIDAESITHVFMVPTMFVRMLRLPEAVRARYTLKSLEWLVHGAAPCPPEVKRAMIDWLGERIYDYYGATELGPITRVSAAEWLARPGTLGRAVPDARIAIYDEAGKKLPAGATGEIYAVNPNYPDFTYHNLPDKRAEAGRDGLITCGDVGYLDAEGYLFLGDRRRDMVISGGVNIYPAEIEAALALMPGVADSAVFGIPDAEFGEAVCAHVLPLPGAALDAQSIRAFLRDKVAGYKLPRVVEIAQSLPREESGKIMKRKLRELYWPSRPQ